MKRLPRLCAVVLAGVAFACLAQSPPVLLIDFSTGSQVRLSWPNTPGNIVLEESDTLMLWGSFPQNPTLLNGQFSVMVDIMGVTRFFRLHQTDGLPPDPASIAPPIPPGAATLLAGATEFLYAAPDPIQTGVAPGTIEARRAAVVRGKVQTRDNSPLSGVTISILNHPELGHTFSRADGMFDLAVNGGGLLIVKFEKTDFCPVQRQVNVPWQDYVMVRAVVMIPMDSIVTSVALGIASPMQVHQGSTRTDADGARKATVFVPEGTTAEMVFSDGSTQTITSLSLRATEFTVGPNGPQAMPAELPPSSGYTYAVDLSVDEARAARAVGVQFSPPLPFHVENFLGFPVGIQVPLGSYDAARGVWVPDDSGRVIGILSLTGGMADLDVDGDGLADSAGALAAMSITDAERQKLAGLYQAGQSLWRVLIPHFTPWDLNWPFGPPDDARPPADDPEIHLPFDDACQQAGSSVIESQNQILGEALGVAGTGFGLHYQSERTPGYRAAYTLEIPLSGDQIPASLRRIELEIQIAGQFFLESFPAQPDQRTTFTWNGRDAYGRKLQGAQTATVRIGYTYGAVYGATARFGDAAAGEISASRARQELTMWRTWQDRIGVFDARAAGMGGWTLSAHHAFDPAMQVLYRGDGRRESSGARAIGPTIRTVAGNGILGASGDGGPATEARLGPKGLAFGPDGSMYIATGLGLTVRRVDPQGIITTVAGTGNFCPQGTTCGDGGPATQAQINGPECVAVGPDNSLYISEIGSSRIRRVGPDGIITTIAGTGATGFSGDGGPGPLAKLNGPKGLAIGPDNAVYIADSINNRIRRVGPDGIITTVAGQVTSPALGDGGPAVQALLNNPQGVAVGRDGSLYITDRGHNRVRGVTPNGIIRTIAGTGFEGFAGDGGPATEAQLRISDGGIAVGPDDTVYLVDMGNNRVRWWRPDGPIDTLAGTGLSGTSGDGGLARQAAIQGLETGLAVGPDGAVYFSQALSSQRVRRISPIAEPFLAGEIAVPAKDGSEIYFFTPNGRHLRTMSALTGTLRYQFSYDASGRLASVTDGDSNVTTIERDGQGRPTAIVGPFGQGTALEVDGNGYLSRVTNPAGEAVELAHAADGLLTGVTWPGGQASSYGYDTLGRLVAATDPTGATRTLTRTGINRDFSVTFTSPLGRATTYRVERLDNGDTRLTTADCASGQAQVVIGMDGRLTGADPEGITRTLVLGPDPRWGMRSPVAASLTTTTSGGLVSTLTTRRTATLAGPGELLNVSALNETVTINGRAWTNTYDGPSRTLVSTSPAGRRGRITLDERGRPAQAQFGDLEPIAYTYDAKGRLASAAQGQGAGARVAVFAYGPDGFLASVTDPFGRTTAFTNDPAGRVTAQTLPDGRVVSFAYDSNGNVRGVTPPGRPEHAFTYTPRDDVAAYTPPAVGAEAAESRFAYDADRKPTRIDHPNGGAVQFQYEDGTCHLNLVNLGTRQRTYAYDAAGQVISLGASQGISLAYAYDGGIFTNATWSGAVTSSVAQTYDSDFRVTAFLVNGADPVAILYDADSLTVQVGGLALTRSPASGFITNTTLGALSDTVNYDGFGAPVSYSASHNGSSVYAAGYTRDLLGRLSQKTETIEGTPRVFDYAYDLAGRLSEVRRDGALAASYSYDPNGNRLSRTDPSGTLNATYNAQDRLLQYGSTTYEYNAKGERVSKLAGGQTTTYLYEGLGNLTQVALPGGTQVEYLLDALDRRVGRKVNGTLVQAFLFQDELRPITELDGTGAVVSRFVYATGANIPDYLIKGGVTYRIITDHLGSPRLVLDIATGQIAQRMDHDEFGRVTLDTNPGFQPFGFAGGLYDQQTGLVHFGAREYDPEAGRWTTKDPIGFAGGDGNLYAYVGNEPVNNIDPVGLCLTTVDCTCLRQPAVCTAIGVGVAKGKEVVRAVNTGGTAAANALSNVACRASTLPGIGPLGARVGQTAGSVVSKPWNYAEYRAAEQLARGIQNVRAIFAEVNADTWFWQTMQATAKWRHSLPLEEQSEVIRWIDRTAKLMFGGF